MTIPGQIATVFLPVNVIAEPLAQAPSDPVVSPQAGVPLQDPRSHPLTRVLNTEGLVTWGRGQGQHARNSAPRS